MKAAAAPETAPAARTPFYSTCHPCNPYHEGIKRTDLGDGENADDNGQSSVYRADLFLTVTANMMDKNPEGFGDWSVGHNTTTALYAKVVCFMLAAVQRMNETRARSIRVYVEALVVNPFEHEKPHLARFNADLDPAKMDMPRLDSLTASLLYDPNNVVGYRFRFVIMGRSSAPCNLVRRQLFENQMHYGIITQAQKDEKMLLLYPEDDRKGAVEKVATQRVMLKRGCSEEKAVDDHDAEIQSIGRKITKSLEKHKTVGLVTSDKDKVQSESDLRFYFRSAVCNQDWVGMVRVLYMIAGLDCPDSPTMGLTAEQVKDESFQFSVKNKKELSPEFCMSFLNSIKVIQEPSNGAKECNVVQMTKKYYVSGEHEHIAFPYPYLVWEVADCSLYELARHTFPWHRRPLYDRLRKDENVVAAHRAQLKREQEKKKQVKKKSEQLRAQTMMKNRALMAKRAVAKTSSSSASSSSAMEVDDLNEFNKFLDKEKEQSAEDSALFEQQTLVSAEDQRRRQAEENTDLLSLRITTQKEMGPMTSTKLDSQLSELATKNGKTLLRIMTVCRDYPYKKGDLFFNPGTAAYFCAQQDKLHEYMSLHRQEVTYGLIGLIKMGGPRVATHHTNSMYEYQRLSYSPEGTFAFVRRSNCPQPSYTLFSNYRLHRLRTFSSLGMANSMTWLQTYNVYLSILRERDIRLPYHAGVIGEAGQNKSYAAIYMNKTMPVGSVQSVDTASAKADATSSWEGPCVRYHDEDGRRLLTETHEVLNKADESRSMMKTLMASNRVAHRINTEEVDPVTGKSRRVVAQCDAQRVTSSLTMANSGRIDHDVEESVGDRLVLHYLVPTKQDVQGSVATRVMGVDMEKSNTRYRESVENDYRDNVMKTFIMAMMDAGSIPQVNLTVFHVVFQKFLEEIRPYLPCSERKARMAIRAETTAFLDTVNLVHYTYFCSEASPWRSRDPTIVEPPSLEQLPSLLSPSMYCPLDVALSSITSYMEELFSVRWAQILRFAAARLCNFYSDYYEPAYATCPVQVRPAVKARAALRGEEEMPGFLRRWYEFANSCDAYVFKSYKGNARRPTPKMPIDRSTGSKCQMEVDGPDGGFDTLPSRENQGKKMKSAASVEAMEATEMYDPNYVQFPGTLKEFAKKLVDESGEVFVMDREVVYSLLTRMRKRTVRIPLMDPCPGSGNGIRFGLHGSDGNLARMKHVEYMTVPCIDEVVDPRLRNGSCKAVRIPVHLLMCPTPVLLYMGLTANECKFTREFDMVLPIEVMGHDDMCETWSTRKTCHPLTVTNPSADQSGAVARFFSGMGEDDQEDEGEVTTMERAGSSIDFLRFSQLFKGPQMTFDSDLEAMVYREHVLANALHPSFDTLCMEEKEDDGDQEESMGQTPSRPALTPEEKKKALETYVDQDLAFPGNMDSYIQALWKENNLTRFQEKQKMVYPDDLIRNINMQFLLGQIGSGLDKRALRPLEPEEVEALARQEAFVKAVKESDNFVYTFIASNFVTPNASRWSVMEKQGWVFPPALRKDLLKTPDIYKPREKLADTPYTLVNAAVPKSKVHQDMVIEFEQLEIMIRRFKYFRYSYGGESLSKTVQRLHTSQNEMFKDIDLEVQKAMTAKRQNVYGHITQVDSLEEKKNVVERVLQAWDKAEKEALLLKMHAYGERSIYWANKIHEQRVLLDARPLSVSEVEKKRKEQEARDATYVGGPGYVPSDEEEEEEGNHRDKRTKQPEPRAPRDDEIDSDDENTWRKRPAVKLKDMHF